jgi:hypothetical protein
MASAAKITGISRNHFAAHCLPHVRFFRIGSRWLIDRESLEQMIERLIAQNEPVS